MLAPGHRYSHSDHMRVGDPSTPSSSPKLMAGKRDPAWVPLVHDAWSSASQPPIVVLVSPIMIIGTARNMAFSF